MWRRRTLLKIGCLVLSMWLVVRLGASWAVVLIPVGLLGYDAPALLDSLGGNWTSAGILTCGLGLCAADLLGRTVGRG